MNCRWGEVGAEPDEAEEEAWWEGRERATIEGYCTVRFDDDYEDYAPPHPDSDAVATASDLELVILFAFGPRYVRSPPISRG